MLGAVDHALQNTAVPAEELDRETVFILRTVGQPPLKREMARPRDIPARPVLIGVKLFRNIQTRLMHAEQYGLDLGAWDKFVLFSSVSATHRARLGSAGRAERL